MPLNDVLQHRAHGMLSFLNSHRVLLYAAVSIASVSVAIANALRSYSNFYSVAIYLSKSSRSVLILANFCFLLALLGGHIVQKVFFGTLRPNEVERLYDRLWFFITESLLAFTIFRDEFDIPFALMFGFLLFVKSFHWLASDRIEWMDQRPYPGPSILFQIRMSTLFVILFSTDLLMFLIAVDNTLTHGVGGMVLFASEYGILVATVGNIIAKYVLSSIDFMRAGRRGGENAPPWEDKSMWVFYIELATDFTKLSTYLVFFTIIITFYGLPLNIIRDVYITARSFISRLRALHRYRTATRNMDERYPNATPEEMASMSDRTCIICREEMILNEAPQAPGQAQNADGPNTTPKKLPCGHIFHFHCLRSWLERQQSCPTCRRTVLEPSTQGQAPPGPLPAPQPGGAPAPNPGGAQGVPNPQPPAINNPLGNPLGLLGRLFGPVQPAAMPVQVQLPQNVNNIPNPANHDQLPPGVVIQYHIQYQVPRPNAPHLPHAPNPPTGPLQPPPEFAGFPGPGGVWQNWPVAGQVNAQQHNNEPAVANPLSNTNNTSAPTPTRQTPPTMETTPEPAEINIDNTANTDAPANPREAAASAALRRFNGARSPLPRPIATGDGQEVETQQTLASTAPNAQNNAPLLIPLYDLGDSGTRPSNISSLNAPAGTSQTGHSTGMRGPVHINRGYPGGPQLPHLPPRQARDTQIPISQLPQTITPEQLAAMDTLTREAIDERLRVLEGVSGAIHRCVDELLRMRSSLPSPSATPTHPPSSTIPATASSSVPIVSSASSIPVALGDTPVNASD
ncbi:hypothetical protein BD779DRAFT_1512509 [Infundibulicybe gibba]|nr:hypothetical protein BD779DRAFT_1512509 [Infundibulicybe gibba]